MTPTWMLLIVLSGGFRGAATGSFYSYDDCMYAARTIDSMMWNPKPEIPMSEVACVPTGAPDLRRQKEDVAPKQ